ncbi:MAG: saccharopine dehydrogenase NADP-binding domain-containing protein [Bdellovibrionales bacterium]|nr:saccharopine dehydrogenase NADP-binding domain-containing protein [Bdellovibrionales bacterium]
MAIVVLGAGRVGSLIANELEREHPGKVLVYDASTHSLEKLKRVPGDRRRQVDLSDLSVLSSLISEEDLVVNALPGSLGFEVLERLVFLGARGVDIAFFEQDPRPLDSKAQESGAAFVYDCGVAPGMSNMIVGRAAEVFDEVSKVMIVVGGLPKVRIWPHEYKAVFSPSDVIEEYVRPARLVRGGREVVLPALSEPEFLDFDRLGTVEAFNTDGLRSLIHTVSAQDMAEKTLRYPGHREKMLFLREAGFFRQDPISTESDLSILDVTSRILFADWQLKPGEADVTVMRVSIEGTLNGNSVSVVASLYDEFDAQEGVTSMARTTGLTACAVLDLIVSHQYAPKGIEPPEILGKSGRLLREVLAFQKKRGVSYDFQFSGVQAEDFWSVS